MKIKEINVSKGFENYSQRNNEFLFTDACGPTNMIQAAEYAGWVIPTYSALNYKQPEDNLMKYTRTNKNVLEYYKKIDIVNYEKWVKEANNLKKENQYFWEVRCIDSYPPNELHKVMNFATNSFFNNKITEFFENTNEIDLITELLDGLPVVSSVKFGSYGHYVTIVGFTVKNNVWEKYSISKNKIYLKNNIIDYIIDNTYGRFNFKTNKYDFVSGDNEHIERKKFLSMLKPLNSEKIIMHKFYKAPSTI